MAAEEGDARALAEVEDRRPADEVVLDDPIERAPPRHLLVAQDPERYFYADQYSNANQYTH